MEIRVETTEGASNSLGALRGDWELLWGKSPRNPFLHPGWVVPFLQASGEKQVLLVAFYRGQDLVALLPLVRAIWGWRVASAPRADSLDILTAMNPEPELIGAIQGWLCTQRQLVCAEELNPESVMARTGVSCTEYAGAVCSVVKLPLALGGGKKRRLRKISSQWARRRPEAIAQHEMVRQVRQEELLQIEQTSSKYRRGIALFGLASTRAVFADAFTGLGQAGLLVRSSVHLDGSVIASLYCVVYPDKLSAYYMAFDDRYAQISPGVWLMIQLMQYAQEQGYQSVDLSRGVSAFKVLFADYTYQQTIRLFGTGPGYLAGRLVHSGANFLDSVRGRMRQRFGISSNETDEQPEE